MLDAAVLLRDETPKHNLQEIKENPILLYGLSKLIEIIGEAAYKLTKEFKDSHPELPWKSIMGMRHALVHDYYAMSAEKLWATITTDISDIIPILEGYLREMK